MANGKSTDQVNCNNNTKNAMNDCKLQRGLCVGAAFGTQKHQKQKPNITNSDSYRIDECVIIFVCHLRQIIMFVQYGSRREGGAPLLFNETAMHTTHTKRMRQERIKKHTHTTRLHLFSDRIARILLPMQTEL